MFTKAGTNLFGVEHIAAFRGRVPGLDFAFDFGAIIGQPLLLFMEHLDSLLHEFIDGLIRPAFYILLNQGFQLGLQMNRHTRKLRRSERTVKRGSQILHSGILPT